jgi:hypothetical protein
MPCGEFRLRASPVFPIGPLWLPIAIVTWAIGSTAGHFTVLDENYF